MEIPLRSGSIRSLKKKFLATIATGLATAAGVWALFRLFAALDFKPGQLPEYVGIPLLLFLVVLPLLVPAAVFYLMSDDHEYEHDTEGRLIQLDVENLQLIVPRKKRKGDLVISLVGAVGHIGQSKERTRTNYGDTDSYHYATRRLEEFRISGPGGNVRFVHYEGHSDQYPDSDTWPPLEEEPPWFSIYRKDFDHFAAAFLTANVPLVRREGDVPAHPLRGVRVDQTTKQLHIPSDAGAAVFGPEALVRVGPNTFDDGAGGLDEGMEMQISTPEQATILFHRQGHTEKPFSHPSTWPPLAAGIVPTRLEVNKGEFWKTVSALSEADIAVVAEPVPSGTEVSENRQ